MSNNSWKQYGGISKTDNFNTINVSTIIADQFISRSVRPTYNFFNGTFEVALDLSAGVNILAGNSIYSAKDVFVNRDVYTNNKLFFGNNTFQNTGNNFPALSTPNTYAYLFGNSSNIGVNTLLPKTVFNITGTIGSVTDILTVESGNVYVRNIIAQNVNQRGVVIDADDVSSNILFYNDVSTNKANIPDATIKFQDGGILTTRTTNRIINSSRTSQIDTSGGRLLMDASGTVLTSSGYLLMDISGEIQNKTKRGYLLNTSGGMVKLDQTTGNMQIDVSNDFIVNCSGGAFLLNDDSTILRTVGNITLLSSGKTGVGGKIVFDSSGGNIDFNSGEIKLDTLLKISPPGRGVSNELLHSETLTIYDNSNSQYLPNVYNDPSILTGNAVTFAGKDSKANTFIYMNPAINKRGSAFGGGIAPYATSRAMAMVGLTGSTGEYIHSQMTVASTNKYKYPSTLGINTYQPRTEDYVLDVNGPMHLGNGEINTVAENSYEIINMNFSKTDINYGIAVGSPSTKSNGVSAQYKQFLLYTQNGGKTWGKSDIFLETSIADNVINVINYVHVFNMTYSAIAANNGLLFLSNNSGISWYRLQLTGQPYTDDVFQTIIIANRPGGSPTTHRIIIAYKENSSATITGGFYYIDCNLLTLFNSAQTYVINIAANRISIGTNIYPVSTGNFNIISASLTPSFIYYAGDFGLARYKFNEVDITTNVYTYAQAYILQNDKRYKGIYAFDDTRVIAVGNNVISYTTTGIHTGWTHINIGLPSAVLNSVFVYDLSNAVVVGSSGKFIYSTNWSTGIWQNIPDKLLNSSGMSDRVTGSENQLKSISMPDINTMIIADATASFIGDSGNFNNTVLGYSKIQYCFLPNLFNRTNNTVFDVSGNMVISGDIEVFDGELLVSTIDYKPQNAADISGTMNFGTKTHVVNIGKNDNRDFIETSLNRKFDTCDSVINIGVTDPLIYDSSTVMINMGNYNQSTSNRKPNKINIGGGNDLVSFGGTLVYSSTQITSSKNKGFQINDLILNDGIVQYMSSNGFTNINLPTGTNPLTGMTGIALDPATNNYTYTFNASNPALETYVTDIYKPYKSGKGSGIFVTDNLDRNAGYLKVSEDMNGWVMKPTNPKSNSLKIDVSSLTLRNLGTSSIADMSYGIHNITNGIAVLTRTIGESDSSYSLTVKQLDINNILVRDSVASSTTQQVINTKMLLKDDVIMNQTLNVSKDVILNSRLFVVNDVSLNSRLFVVNDVSLNRRLYVGGDASFNGNVDITGLLRATSYQNNYIINTVTNNYEFIVTTDMSMSGNLYVNGDTSLNGFVDISGRVAIGKRNPTVALDISYSDAIRIPKGTTAQRPTTSTEASHGGYIRYNHENHQFEGYGPGNSWGSLGGVINVSQNTKIVASSPNADSSNNDLMFFTARRWDISTNSALERMRIDGSGNVGIGTTAPACTLHVDISNNPEQTFWTSMMTHTSLKSQKNSDLERFAYNAYPAYDFKVLNATFINDIVAAYISYRTTPATSFANYLPFGVTGISSSYFYGFEGTNLDLEIYVKNKLSVLIGNFITTKAPAYNSSLPSGVGGSSGAYTYDFNANNFELEHFFITDYITYRNIATFGSGLPYGVTGTSGTYKYDFVRSIGSAIGKNTIGLNNSAEIKYWHIDDLSTSNALSFGFNQNSNKIFIRADGRTGIGTINPRSSVDISYTDALIIPSGTAVERPLGLGETRAGFSHQAITGMIRYNKTNSQFEGYGPGNSWGSLGGVINVAQNTKIIASSPNADSTNNDLMFFTAPAGNITLAAGVERMRIKADGDISMNFKLAVAGDVSMNGNVQIAKNINLKSDSARIILGLDDDVIIQHDGSTGLDIDASGQVSINSRAGLINIGNDLVAQNINIGSGGVRTIQVGNAASTAVNLDALAVTLTSINALTLTDGTANFNMNGGGVTTLGGMNTFALDASGSASINSSAGAINIGNNAVAQNINIGSGASARTIQVGNAASTAVNLDALAVTLRSVNAMTLTDGNANFTMNGAGATTLSGMTTFVLDASGSASINSSAGVINIGNNAVAQSINIGSGGARTIQVGNTGSAAVKLDASNIILTSVDALTLTDGNANFTMNGVGATTLNGMTSFNMSASGAMSMNSSSGEINIGNNVVAQNINIGSGGARTIQVGNAASTAVNLDALALTLRSVNAMTLTDGNANFTMNGAGATTLSGMTTFALDASGSASINSSAGVINIGNNAVAQNINIGSGGVRTIQVGNAASTAVNLNAQGINVTSVDFLTITDGIAIFQMNGAGYTSLYDVTSFGLTASGVISVNSSAGVINIGNNAVAQNINIGSGGARTIQVGNAASTAVNLDALAVTLRSVNAMTLTDGNAYFAMNGAGATTFAGMTTFALDASGSASFNSSAGEINIGNNAVAQPINIGSGGVRTIQVGNAASTAVNLDALAVTLRSVNAMTLTDGNAYFAMNGAGATTFAGMTTFALDASGSASFNSSAGEINIGNNVVAQPINIGSGGVRTIQVGNAASTAVKLDALAVTLTSVNALTLTDGSANFTMNGTGATTLGGMTTFALDASGSASINSSAGEINIGNNAVAQPINIGSGGVRTIQVGNAASTAVNLDALAVTLRSVNAMTLTDGTASIVMDGVGATTLSGATTVNMSATTVNMSATTVNMDATGAVSMNSSAGVINIGNNAVAQNINIGSGASARTIQVGNAASTAVNLDALAVTLRSVNALTLTDGNANFTMDGVGATTLSGATTVGITATGAVTINSAGASNFTTTSGNLTLHANSSTGNVIITANNATGMIVNSSGNVGIRTTAPAFPLDIKGDTGTLLRLQNNTAVYNGGTANIEFWSGSNNNPLGMIKTTDIGVGPSSAYKSKMEFFVNLNSTSTGTLITAMKLESTGVEATSYNATSDYRIKDNLISLPDCSFVVDPLRPVYYRNKLTNKQDIGLIAHEVQEHFPFLVNGEKDGEHNQSVNYTGFIALLIHETQQLKRRVSDLEKQAPTGDNEDGYKQKSIHYDGLFPHLIESIKTLTQENKDLVSKVDVLTHENEALVAKVDKIMTILDKLNISV